MYFALFVGLMYLAIIQSAFFLGSDYPDINIGTEPTTDRFIVVMKGPEKKVMQGHALVNHKGLSFRTLHKVISIYRR